MTSEIKIHHDGLPLGVYGITYYRLRGGRVVRAGDRRQQRGDP